MTKKLNFQIFLGIFLGVLAGLIAREEAVFLQHIGEMFVRLLKMLIIPLVSTSIVIGVVNLGDIRQLSKLGGVTAIFFMLTTVIAATIGIVVANFFKPGLESGIIFDDMPQELTPILPGDLVSIFTEIVPQNIVADMAEGKLLPFIFFSIILGASFIAIGRKGEPVIKFFDSLNDAILKLVD